MLRALNLLEPRKDGKKILSLSKLWLFGGLILSCIAVWKFPEYAAGIIGALLGSSGLNYGLRRIIQHREGGVK